MADFGVKTSVMGNHEVFRSVESLLGDDKCVL